MRSWFLSAAHLPSTPVHLPLVQFQHCTGQDLCSRRQNCSSLALSQALLPAAALLSSAEVLTSHSWLQIHGKAMAVTGVLPAQEKHG